ncbi:hypothetical protein F506_19095 [Herbaspirillum hiltneri N3]|uniref:Uncharacterized protein n=1 Tax=Herbaspirillum hiltneri N3 TaxID=1262470 RepID=A0ABM5V4C2_9BURK|nr:hypothetical protein [Herbaspirillum hiltneri]AKZ64482.1 hypothetical protein F506_19095 [Herbaspirillum hiltneri N3]
MEFTDFWQGKIHVFGLLALLCIGVAMAWRLLRSLNNAAIEREAKEAEDFAQHLAHMVYMEQYAVCPERERRRALDEAASICKQLERQS